MSKSTEQSTVAPAPAATLLFQAPDLANAVPAPVQQSAGPENEKHSDKKSKGTKSAKKGDEQASKKKSRSNKKNE